jgi:uncharacterized protein YodC (DUF2158 family)
MASRNFKVGDVVALCSGGFPMTIESIVEGVAQCVWSGKEQIRRDTFDMSCLKWWSEIEPDFTLLIPGLNISEDDAALLPREGVH